MERYTVIFRKASGTLAKTTCVTTDGYSTAADIPKMITIKYGDAARVVAILDETVTGAELATVLTALGAASIWTR